jgi:hypothetical protein
VAWPVIGFLLAYTVVMESRVRLWVLLHGQALLRGTAGGWDDAAVIEDDCRRLAARRQA